MIITAHRCDHFHKRCGIIVTHSVDGEPLPRNHNIITTHPWDHFLALKGYLPHTHWPITTQPWKHYYTLIGSLPGTQLISTTPLREHCHKHWDHYHTLSRSFSYTLRSLPHNHEIISTHTWDHPLNHYQTTFRSLPHTHGIINTHPLDQYHMPMISLPQKHGISTIQQ